MRSTEAPCERTLRMGVSALQHQHGIPRFYACVEILISDVYRGTSLMRKRTPLGPYRGPMAGIPKGSWGGEHFLMGEVPQ